VYHVSNVVAVSEGRSDIQRLIDVDGDPVVAGQYLVTTSFKVKSLY
jgi:outer membrane protein assembly factor BamB